MMNKPYLIFEKQNICNWLQKELQINEFPIFLPYLQYKTSSENATNI